MKRQLSEEGVDRIEAEKTLDCYGLLCPMPIIQAANQMRTMKIGDVLEVISTDKGIKEDMPAWCRQTGQEFLGFSQDGDVYKVFVRKAKN